jgi:AraC-like DNA-binding protein
MSGALGACERWVIDAEADTHAPERLQALMADVMLPYSVRGKAMDRRGRRPLELRRVRFGSLAMLESDVPDLFSGDSRAPCADTPARLVITLVTDGAQAIEQAGRQAHLQPGDLFIVDGAQPGTCRIASRVRACMLVVPRALVPIAGPLPGKLSRASPVGRLLGDYMRLLARDLASLPEAAASIAADSCAELVRLVATTEQPSLDSRAVRVALLPQVRRYIERHLADPELAPSTIAAANAISLRTLHAMFAPTGESVRAFIRRRRLQCSRDDLLDRPDLPVIDVARRWGFKNPSHFSRVFKEEFGMAPRDVGASGALDLVLPRPEPFAHLPA